MGDTIYGDQMIRATDIKKSYGKKNNNYINVLQGISLEIHTGEYVAICGKSGSGKTTLLNILSGLSLPSAGNVFYDDININMLKSEEIASFRRNNIGFVFQSFYLEPEYTVYQNAELPLLFSNSEKVRDEVIRQLEKAGLSEKQKVKAKYLSGGEQQRLCIARALANHPNVIFADEPCGNLDSENTETIMKIFDDLHESGKTIIMVTHDLESARRADRIIWLKDGKIVNEEDVL